MAESEVKISENSILFELLVYSEWIQDFDNKNGLNLLSQTPTPKSLLSPWRLFKKSQLQLDFKKYLLTDFPWHLATSQDGKLIAVLQETTLEIRSAKDEYSSIVGKASFLPDNVPQLRLVEWSPDSTILAVAHDNGSVKLYNLLGSNIATIPPSEAGYDGMPHPVVGLIFLQPKFKVTKWSNELLVVHFNGVVRSFFLPAFDSGAVSENIKCSLQGHYRDGITAVAYLPSHHLVLMAGPSPSDTSGITAWRILSDQPYLKMTFDSPRAASPRSLFRLLSGFAQQNPSNTVTRMRVSPRGDMLGCLHCSGDISLWHLPAMRLHRRWTVPEQPQHHVCPPSAEPIKGEQHFHPVDIGWWSDSALVVARRSGAISVCSMDTLENLLGDSPEFFSGPSQIAAVQGDRAGFIALECEMVCNYRKRRLEESDAESEDESETSVLQASIQAALYSITDIERFQPKRKTPKLIQRTYRLVGLKSTTPEELYARKIDNEEYAEALTLARAYGLDCDLVYQRQWRNSNVSVDSIYNYLEKVGKRVWVVSECVERVPDSLAAAKELLLFGLKTTEVQDELEEETEMTSDLLKLVTYRRQILLFLDNLTIYERIIGSPDKYDSMELDEFRRMPAIASAVRFARREDWHGVSMMLTYRPDTLPHWLPILSNFPETSPPFLYRSLLPEVCAGAVVPWPSRSLRDPDWSERLALKMGSLDSPVDVSNQYLYEADTSLRQFRADSLTPPLVEEWYERRAYEIEQNTGLVDHALSFIKLAREKNVQNLDRLYFDLLTLEALVYSVQDEDVSFSKLKQLSHLDQVKLILAKTEATTLLDDLQNLLLPFASRCEKLGCDTAFSLLRGLCLHFSQESLDLPLALMQHFKDDDLKFCNISMTESMCLALDCIYACPRDDQLETGFQIFECLPQRERSKASTDEEDLWHARVDALESYLEVCEILERYNMRKSVKYIKENEDNPEVAMELMEEVAEYTKSETLDFSELLDDLTDMQSKVFNCVEPIVCYEVFALKMLSCECEEIIESAQTVLSCRPGEAGKPIGFERSVELVLTAARNHFEKGSSFDDPCIKLAGTCLGLINEPHPEIHEELDLIESIQLLGVFHVGMLPLQVRLCVDRMNLIEACLRSKPEAYKSCQRLLQLAQTLRIHGEDRMKREGEVLTKIAEHAISVEDFNYCSEVCSRLVSRNYTPAWKTIRRLGQSEQFTNVTQRRVYLAFAILHCPVENMEELIECRATSREMIFPRPPPISS